MGKKNMTPRGIAPEDNQSQTAQQNPADNTQSSTTGNANDPTQSSTFFKKPKMEQGVRFVISIILSWGLYAIFSYVLKEHGVNFFLSHLVSCILSLMLLNYLDSIFESPVKIAKPVLLLMTLLLCYDLSVKYLPEYGKNNSKNELSVNTGTLSPEVGTLNSVGSIWFTDKIFKNGDKVKIEVLYNNVKMINGDILSPGIYSNMNVYKEGQLTFEGLMNKIAQVKVSY